MNGLSGHVYQALLAAAVDDNDNWPALADYLEELGDERAALVRQLVDAERYLTAAYVLDEDRSDEVLALALHLECDPDDIATAFGHRSYDVGNQSYIVATDEQADEIAAEYIRDSLWAFNADFLASKTGIPEEMFRAVQERSEDANDAVLRCIEKTCGLDDFVDDAIAADGRAHFLNHYDGTEEEQEVFGTTYYIYRTN
jgi:hypothetical protein